MIVSIENITYDLAAEIKNDKLFIRSNGINKEYYIRKLNDNYYVIYFNNRPLRAFTASDKNNKYIFIEGKSYVFKIVNEDLIDYYSSASSINSEKIKAPMPGTVIKVIASIGDKLKEGDPVIIIEAMKMETTLYSTISGTLKGISVVEGQQIDSDSQLALIEKEE